MYTTEIVLHADHRDDGSAGVGVVARVDRTIDAYPIVRVYIGESMVLTMSPALADALADALVDAAETAADPPVVAYG